MDMRSIYIANGVGIFILLILRYTSHARSLRRNMEDKIFTFMVLGVALGCLLEAFAYIIDGQVFPGARVLNYLANTYLFTMNLLLPFSVLVYVDLGLYGNPGRIRKRYKPQMAIGAIMLGLNVVNFFVPIVYYITDANVYERRPMSYLYYFVILYYCLTALVVTRRYEKENGAKTFVRIEFFLVPILVGAGLQFMFYGLSVAWLSAAVGLTGLYMMQQNEMAYIDSLVDTYNRQYMTYIISNWVSRGRKFLGVMVDIDRFKSINDRFGHSEGDEALKTVASILKASRQERELVFRFAGDEFIVLKLTDSPKGLDGYMDEVNRRLEERNQKDTRYRLALSYGTSYLSEGHIDDFMKEMDSRMYVMKNVHHSREKETPVSISVSSDRQAGGQICVEK